MKFEWLQAENMTDRFHLIVLVAALVSVLVARSSFVVALAESDTLSIKDVDEWSKRDLEDSVELDDNLKSETFNVIDGQRFFENVNSRCLASTKIEDPELLAPTFRVIRPGQPDVELEVTSSLAEIVASGLNVTLRTTILVPGVNQYYPRTRWTRTWRDVFFKTSAKSGEMKENLISMDWHKSSSDLVYPRVAARASGMGSYLARFVQKLLELGVDRMKIHLIGHSLGAHLVGFAGKQLRPRIGRITGLDPAGACFGRILNGDDRNRLARGDAHRVVVYHFDDYFLGLPGNHGDVDIFVNGGVYQPGAEATVKAVALTALAVLFGGKRKYSPSHMRPIEMATIDLSDNQCQHIAYLCDSYDKFNAGECGYCDDLNTQCYFMDFPHQYTNSSPFMSEASGVTSSSRGQFYLTTGGKEPFCSQHYQILVRIEHPDDFEVTLKVKLNLKESPDGENNQSREWKAKTSHKTSSGEYSHLLTFEGLPNKITNARVKLSPKKNLKMSEILSLQVKRIDINYMSNIDPEIRKSFSSQLCLDEQSARPSEDFALEFSECRQLAH